MAKILIVEDEKDLATLIGNWLKREHHLVETVHDGVAALEQLRFSSFDVIILDWMLPKLSGIDVCKDYRGHGGDACVLMITARDGLDNKEKGFNAGVDDYITKPLELKELSMRINAHLRRASQTVHTTFDIRDIHIDIQNHKVFKAGKEVHLLPKEFRLLEFFVRHPNRIFSAEELISSVWESDSLAQNDTVRGHINRLRKKLDDPKQPSIVGTVHGVGYKLTLDENLN